MILLPEYSSYYSRLLFDYYCVIVGSMILYYSMHHGLIALSAISYFLTVMIGTVGHVVFVK